MANSANGSDIVKGALYDVGELTDGTSRLHELAIEKMNTGYLSVLSGGSEFNVTLGEPWTWARNATPASIILQPKYITGSVSFVNGSTTITFNSTPAASLGSFKYRWLKNANQPTYYLVTAHTAGAATATIDTAYIEATEATASFTCFTLLYNLGSGILRLTEPLRVYGNWNNDPTRSGDSEEGKIYGMEINELRKKWPLYLMRASVPSRFATQRRSDSEWWIEVNAFPDQVTKVDYDYIPMPAGLIDSDTSVPVIPREFRDVLRYATAHFLAIKKENADLGQYFFNMTQQKLNAMYHAENKNTTVSGKNKGKLIARQEQTTERLTGYY